MQFRIPSFVIRFWDWFVDWSNIPIKTFGRFELCWLDVIVTVLFIFCISYSGWIGGWLMAAQGGALSVLFAIIALFYMRG
jgi:hypothetical protein